MARSKPLWYDERRFTVASTLPCGSVNVCSSAAAASLKRLPAIAGRPPRAISRLIRFHGEVDDGHLRCARAHPAVPYGAPDYSMEARPIREVTSVRRAAIRAPE